ncbi:Cell division protein FtsY homolog [Alloiococcus otitis]|uniref:Signal recognition particle receptor FtsY n=1 Tax=Alloiococcus otitis ATCC 51267 TaxID=883081 RepID=K9EUY6_9LACT|nr:signal recognition particle-docking protein FtsY [Alloiococcus otitis]EKU93015.1 signal recognition particle-docking protein FtsY [Alloiococcus otitis ATCC 51267]SUU80877.1 Cell division protein FtsY homolog [Alloiococcus otitis]
MGLFDKIKKVFTGESKEKDQEKQGEEAGGQASQTQKTNQGQKVSASPSSDQGQAESTDQDLDSSSLQPSQEKHQADIAGQPSQKQVKKAGQGQADQTQSSQAKPSQDRDQTAGDQASQTGAGQESQTSQAQTTSDQAQSNKPNPDQGQAQASDRQDRTSQPDQGQADPEASQPSRRDPEEVARLEAQKYTEGLSKSRRSFTRRLNELFANFRYEDEEFFEELEDLLIESDVGFEATMFISEVMRHEAKVENIRTMKDAERVLVKTMVDLYGDTNPDYIEFNDNPDGLTVILFVGVNGVGKTTTIAKMAHQYQEQGKKVILAAGDTFRAGAIEQLHVWGDRIGAPVVSTQKGGDPAAVVYDGIAQAKDQGADVLLIDTAGRLQNKKNLMNELEKMKRVISREIPDAPHETLLVLDATTGQNALSQAKIFKETTDVTGIVLTKMDGTAKGGIVLAIGKELGIPVKFVGLGETMDDLHAFDTEKFAIGLFRDLIEQTA